MIPNSVFTSSAWLAGQWRDRWRRHTEEPRIAASTNATSSPYLVNASNTTAGTFNPAHYTIKYVWGKLTITAQVMDEWEAKRHTLRALLKQR